MKEEPVHILGICGSPIKGGNVEYFLTESLKTVEFLDGVSIKKILLADCKVSDCRHCSWCVSHATPEKCCSIEDDMALFYPEIIKADALLFASPVYIAKMSGYLTCFLDRMRVFAAGNLRGCLKNKVAGALAVSWFRHGGVENTLLGIYSSLLVFECIPVSVLHSNALFGAGAYSSIEGTGKLEEGDHLLIKRDGLGLKGGQALVKRMVELTRIIKAGQKVRVEDGRGLHLLRISKRAEELERTRLKR